MKLLILLLFVKFLLTEACEDEEEEFEPIKQYYHIDVGIKRAAEIKKAEMKALRRRKANETKLKSPYPYYRYYGGLLIKDEAGVESVCGSALLSNTAVLTAAQCWFDGVYQATEFEVVLGSQTLYYGGVRRKSKSVKVNPSYNYKNGTANVAVIYIEYAPYYGPEYLKPIFLPVHNFGAADNYVGQMVETMGFNLIGSPDVNAIAAALLLVMTNAQCAETYGTEKITEEVICARAAVEGGLCKGDFGSPLVLDVWGNAMVIGVNSFIVTRGCEVWPPVGFTRVLPYKKWIESLI